MRRYFYLKKGNEWSRSLTIFEFIFLVLIRKVNRFDTVWHTGLCPANMPHPDECIHPSVQVREIPFLPNWLFQEGYGIPDLWKKTSKKLQSYFSSKDSFEEFAKTPLEMPKLLENAKSEDYLMRVSYSRY